jgi:hypothetical protein
LTDIEIKQAILNVDILTGMSVNERLYACGIMEEFDTAMKIDIGKARRILELLSVDRDSIDQIIL